MQQRGRVTKSVCRTFGLLAVLTTAGCGGSCGGGGGTPPPAPIAAPSSLVALAVSSSQINLSWTNNATNQTGFTILRSLDGVAYATAGTAAANVTSFQDTGLFPLTTYWYKITATNASTSSPTSNVASATTSTVTWVKLAPGGTPPAPRVNMAAVLDTATNQMLVYSGDDGSFPPSNVETLALNLVGAGTPAWASLAAGPTVRQYYSFVYLAGQGGVLFGGSDGTVPRNETWVLNPSTGWSAVTTAGTPPSPRFGHSAILVGMKMYIFGGQDANPFPNNLLNDVYALDFSVATPTWNQLSPGGSPPEARAFHAAVFDAGNNQMVIFGGQDTASNLRNDTWVLSLSGMPAWAPLMSNGIPPSGRLSASAIYNSVSHMMVIFGGDSAITSGNDVWFLSLSGAPFWKEAIPAGPLPPGRGGHAATFDASAPRMLIFAGQDISTFPGTLYNDVWALDF